MNLKQVLEQVLMIKGITSAAVVNSEGMMIEGVSATGEELGFIGNIIASGLASSRVLASLLGDGDIQQTMIEYEGGPVLLTPLSADEQAHVMVATLEATNTLGRARFQLRKLMPEITKAVPA